jgi:serine/threonine protein kinase
MIGGRFRIEESISHDNVGHVYRAFDTSQGAPAAVRVIPLRLLGASSKTLEVDVEKASAVIHPNLVSVLMIGREADFYFIAAELMDGQTLREFMDGKRADGRGISFKGAYNLLSHIANALEKAHDLPASGSTRRVGSRSATSGSRARCRRWAGAALRPAAPTTCTWRPK